MERVILVDNYISAYADHPRNGVPILPFFEDEQDTELDKLATFLLSIAGLEDVRPAIESLFMSPLFHESPDLKQIILRLQTEYELVI